MADPNDSKGVSGRQGRGRPGSGLPGSGKPGGGEPGSGEAGRAARGAGKPGSGRPETGKREDGARGQSRSSRDGTRQSSSLSGKPQGNASRAQAAAATRRPVAAPLADAASGFISPARAAAFDILQRVVAADAHSDDLLHGERMRELSQADRNLATTLVLGTLRWQIALDARLRPMLQRPDLGLALPVWTALRLGAFQLLYLDRVPAHAALNESVELVRAAGQPHAAGMVNALLRRLTREPAPRRPIFEPVAALAERMGHPAWLVERWVAAFGRAAAEAICAYDQGKPQVAGIFADEPAAAEADPENALEEGASASPDALSPPRMDDGSRLVAELAAVAGAGAQRVWDCCAAPGGKTIVLAQRLPTAEVLATDASPRRLRALAGRLRRDLAERETLPAAKQADATALPLALGDFDLILCDAPCSGTGTLARNPEIRLRMEPPEIRRQAERQRQLLTAALQRLKRGGRLVYSTCSLEPEENERVVEAVLAEVGSSFRVVPVASALQALAERKLLRPEFDFDRIMQGLFLRTIPGYNLAGDGFFAAVIERVG